MLKPRNKPSAVRPESPMKRDRSHPPTKQAGSTTVTSARENNGSDITAPSKVDVNKISANPVCDLASDVPIPIVASEEIIRLRMLDRRAVEVRRSGIIEAIKNLLDGTPGVLPSSVGKNITVLKERHSKFMEHSGEGGASLTMSEEVAKCKCLLFVYLVL